jgi:hypothetical protein
MKKLFLLAAVTILALTACSSDDTLNEPQKTPIAFSTFVDRAVKADITTDNITKFKVYGYMTNANGVVFSGEEVTKGSDSKWGYTNTQYWTVGKNYAFTAIAPTDATYTYTAGDLGEGTILFTNDGTKDLVADVQTVTSATASQGTVAFTLGHLLARVKFQFTNSLNNSNTTLVVKNVKIAAAPSVGTYTQKTSTWSFTADTQGSTALDFGSTGTTKVEKDATGSTSALYLYPLNQTYSLSFDVEVYHGTELAATYSHTGVTVPQVAMSAGNSYQFKADLDASNINPDASLSPIVFDVTSVSDWADYGTATTFPESEN